MNPRRLHSATISSRVTSGVLVSAVPAICGAEATASVCGVRRDRWPALSAAGDLRGHGSLPVRGVESVEDRLESLWRCLAQVQRSREEPALAAVKVKREQRDR